MYKLHIKKNDAWLPVFCQKEGRVITCKDVRKALPSLAVWGQSDLNWFSDNFRNDEFKLINVKVSK